MQCNLIKIDGSKCQANAMTGSEYCFSHNPEMEAEKDTAVLKGGLSPKPRKDAQLLDPVSVKNIPEIISLLEDTINRVRTEPMTHQKANSIGYLANVVLKALETSDLAKRIEIIETVLIRRTSSHD